MTTNAGDYIFEPFKVTEVTYRGDLLPRPRSGHRIVCDDINIYCFGGYNPSLPLSHVQRNNPTWTPARPLFKELWSYCIASKKWKEHRLIQNMPDELASNAMCMNGRFLMIFGGTGAPFGNKCSNDVIMWRSCSNDTKLQILDADGQRPPGQYGQSIFCHEGYMYTVGGTNGFAYSCDIYSIAKRAKGLRDVKGLPLPITTKKTNQVDMLYFELRGSAYNRHVGASGSNISVAKVNLHLLVVHLLINEEGTDENSSERALPGNKTLVWEPVFVGTGQEGEPFGRYRHEIARVENKLYILGGGTGDWAFELMEVPVFDLEKRTWTLEMTKADDSKKDTVAPLPRKCHSAVQIDTPSGVQVFVAGGTDGQSVFNDIWKLNIEDLQWSLMQKTVLPHPLYFHSSTVTSSGCMYVFGGIEPKEHNTMRNNILYKVWLCIPKLSEICWDALLALYPSLDQVDGASLVNIGIPRHFVHRLHQQ